MIMAKRNVLFVVLMLLVLPAFSDGPKKSGEQPEFYFTPLMYHDIYGRGPSPGEPPPDPDTLARQRGLGDFSTRILGMWMMDAWDADFQYMWGIQRLTNVKLSVEPHPVPIMWKDLFDYPYLYAVEVGHMELTDAEATRLREY